MSSSIDVSVVIAAYEASEFIGSAIKSCLNQTNVNLEVIVVDDGSQNPSRAAVEAAANGDERVRYIGLEQNTGPSGARNAGFDAARGSYIAILDADDSMLPDRLSRLVAGAKKHDADIIADNMLATPDLDDEAARTPFLIFDDVEEGQPVTLVDYISQKTESRFGRSLGYLKPVFSRTFLEEKSIRYDLSLTNSEDFYIVAEMLAQDAKMVLLPYDGYIYLQHDGSISYRLDPRQTAAILDAETAFQRRHAARLGETGEAAAADRLAALRKTHEYEVLRADLRAHNPLAFLKHLMANPKAAPAHIGAISRVLLNRL